MDFPDVEPTIRTDAFALGYMSDIVVCRVITDNVGVLDLAGNTYTAFIYNPTPCSFGVTFDAAGGTPDSRTLVTGDDGKLLDLPDGPQKRGFDFAGWFTEESGGEQVDFDTVFTQDTTVYAHWVSVPIHVTQVILNWSTAKLVASDTLELVVTVLPSDATDRSIVWSVDDKTIAKVDENGLVTALKAGKATVMAMSVDNGQYDTCDLYISEPPPVEKDMTLTFGIAAAAIMAIFLLLVVVSGRKQ